jgi:hypothetical protein
MIVAYYIRIIRDETLAWPFYMGFVAGARYPRMFMGLIVVAITGGGAVLLGETLERRLTPWVTH